ncbi:hypothetical protein J6590_108350 [Homalodisca vitripennis]|nr:hypothetical protein J6590_108350 [Homalodisca vitripennis]
MYADDTVLLNRNCEPDRLEAESFDVFNKTEKYCQQNDLVLNRKKSQQIIFGRRKDEVVPLPELLRAEEAKYLGITIDNKLSWTPHVNELCGKLSSALYVLRRLKQISGDDTVRTAYFALLEAHLRYGIAVWGATSKSNMQRVLILQKKAVRILAGLNPRDHCRRAFKQNKILTVISLYIIETVMYAIKQELERGYNVHTHNTRTASHYTLPQHRLALFERQPTYKGTKFLNILPEKIKNTNCTKEMRNLLVKWLLERPFYSIEEFENWRREPLQDNEIYAP